MVIKNREHIAIVVKMTAFCFVLRASRENQKVTSITLSNLVSFLVIFIVNQKPSRQRDVNQSRARSGYQSKAHVGTLACTVIAMSIRSSYLPVKQDHPGYWDVNQALFGLLFLGIMFPDATYLDIVPGVRSDFWTSPQPPSKRFYCETAYVSHFQLAKSTTGLISWASEEVVYSEIVADTFEPRVQAG